MPVFADALTGIEIYWNSWMTINAIGVTEQWIWSNIPQVSDMLNTYKSFLFLWITSSKIIIWILVHIFLVICLRKIFKKAWRKWWQSLIPIRNIFVLFKIIGKRFWFLFIILPAILIILLMIFRLLMFFDMANSSVTIFNSIWSSIITLIYPITIILSLILIILSCFRLAKKFWKSGWFWVWILFLTPIFLWILAFGKAEYLGENNQ